MQLSDYYPPVTGETKDFKAMAAALQPELTEAFKRAELILGNQFIEDMDEYGVKRWEQMLKITPLAADDISVRKARILLRMNEYPPFTIGALKRMLGALCGEDGYSVSLKHDIYHLKVTVKGVSESIWYDVRALLTRLAPANLSISLTVSHSLPCAFVYGTAYISGPIYKTVIIRDLFFEDYMEVQLTAGAAVAEASYTVPLYNEGDLSGLKKEGRQSGVMGVYRKTMLFDYLNFRE